jgi:Na+/H+ antiporter NhaC
MDAVVDPGWLSLLPPLAAIILALITREVVISLFAGIWLGALFTADWNPLTATLRTVDEYAVGALAGDADHVAIVVFTLLLGGMVGVMSRSGGTLGMVEAMRPAATSRRRGQFFTWLSGIAIFFDDYANTLIVGTTMRPITDRLRVSREKLAYVVDSTAAPMAAIALISTWVGFEITLIGDALESAAGTVADPAEAADLLAAAGNPFNVFLHSIPYLFYPILALFFVLMIVVTGRDFGPRNGRHPVGGSTAPTPSWRPTPPRG